MWLYVELFPATKSKALKTESTLECLVERSIVRLTPKARCIKISSDFSHFINIFLSTEQFYYFRQKNIVSCRSRSDLWARINNKNENKSALSVLGVTAADCCAPHIHLTHVPGQINHKKQQILNRSACVSWDRTGQCVRYHSIIGFNTKDKPIKRLMTGVFSTYSSQFLSQNSTVL